MNRIPALHELVQTGDHVVKEHFDAYRNMRSGIPRKIPSAIFNICVDRTPRGPRTWDEATYRFTSVPVEPAYPGLVIVSRAELSLPAYHALHPDMVTTYRAAQLAELAIQANSLLNLLPELQAKPHQGSQEQFLADFTLQIAGQIQSA